MPGMSTVVPADVILSVPDESSAHAYNYNPPIFEGTAREAGRALIRGVYNAFDPDGVGITLCVFNQTAVAYYNECGMMGCTATAGDPHNHTDVWAEQNVITSRF